MSQTRLLRKKMPADESDFLKFFKSIISKKFVFDYNWDGTQSKKGLSQKKLFKRCIRGK